MYVTLIGEVKFGNAKRCQTKLCLKNTFHCFSLEEGNHRFTAKSTDGFSKAPTSSFLGLQFTLLALVPNPQMTINYRFLQDDDASD